MLNTIKILDFTRLLPGPLATHLLSQMGAEVTKIEHPKRMDYTRHFGKQVDGASALFHALNHRKVQKTIDYQSEAGKAQILEMVKQTDVLIEQFRPGAMDGWGLGYDFLKTINPTLIYVSLTGYGQQNSKANEAGHDVNYMANAGLLSLLKDGEGKPIVPGFQLGDIGGGSYMTVMAVQSAIIQKLLTGKGAYVDVAMTKGLLPLLAIPLQMEWSGLPHEHFNGINGKTLVNYSVYQCADGKWLALGALELKFWNAFCDRAGKPEWKREKEMELSVHVFPKGEVEAFFKQKTLAEWVVFFAGKEVCIAPVLEIEDLPGNSYLNEINAFETFRTHGGRFLRTTALPFDARE